MKCKQCGKELPEYAVIIRKEFCSQECEDKYKEDNGDEFFTNFFNNLTK